jgi:futalosine hydrolase
MPFESDHITAGLKNVQTTEIAGKKIYRGKLSGVSVVLINTGIGKINAAHSSTCIIENFPVSCMLNFGVGGAYPGSGLVVGDLAAASREILGDDGVIDSKGWSSLKSIGIPVVKGGRKKYFNDFPVNLPPVPFSAGGNKKVKMDIKIKTGNFVTVSATSGTQKRARELEKRFSAICENMEGAAIAQICTLYKFPLIEIRGISNIAGVRDKRRWNLNLASENCQKAVTDIIGPLEGLIKGLNV